MLINVNKYVKMIFALSPLLADLRNEYRKLEIFWNQENKLLNPQLKQFSNGHS